MNRIVKVNGQPVWDYKIVQTGDGTLYLSLITETYGEKVTPDEYVTEEELEDFLKSQGLTSEIQIISETVREVMEHCDYEKEGEVNYYE
jgi:hypothetical protein